MTNDELNEALSNLADREEFAPNILETTGKALPYWGWYWRTVDFDTFIWLAYRDDKWVGFCENNKWNYEMFKTTADQTAEIKRLCIEFAQAPSVETATMVFNYLQAIKPENVTGTQRYDD